MTYQKRKNNRIQDLNQINYIKNILEASAKQCQDEGMYSPEVYLATAQRMADAYSAQNSQYPRITFNSKEQKLRNQQNSVTELTATIGERTSTSYFLVKDSLSEGTSASQEELTYLRPDIVSNRIATNLGIAQTPPIPPIAQTKPGQGIPAPTPINSPQAPTMPFNMSKAEMMATQANTQQQIDVPPIPPQATQPNSLLDGFAALAKDAVPPQPIPPQAPVAPPVNKNPYAAAPIPPTKAVPPQPVPLQPIHNPQLSEKIKQTNQNFQKAGTVSQHLGQALKDMARGQINPIQLYGDTLKIMGNFLNGIPAGIQEARLEKIAQQMQLVSQKKADIDRQMDSIGDELIASGTVSAPPITSSAPTQTETKTSPQVKPGTSPLPIPPQSQSQSSVEPITEAIDKLLKSNASIDHKLDAIEKTLDKMLEQLNKIEENLAAISKMIETEVKTEVEVVANDPMTEVPIRTEIDTDIVAEAKTEIEAAKEVEVPSVIVDSIPDESELDLDQELANVISSYEGNLDRLNQHLQNDKLRISLAEDGSYLSIAEVDHGILDPIFNAEANGAGWNIQSGINDSKKLEVLESFVEAEAAALAEPEPESKQVKESQVPVQQDFCIT